MGLIAGVALLALGAPASALAASPPSISSTFTPALITVGGTSTLSVTISNPDPTATLSGVAFTDNLPAGVVVDNPSGQSGTCGSAGVLTATPGASTITLSAGKLSPGTTCTVSANVTSSTTGVVPNSTGAVSASGGLTGNSDTESLTVAGLPTVSLHAPRDGSTFNFKHKVKASFSCVEGTLGPGISACLAEDDNGATISSGSPIDTSLAGAHALTVIATSADGQVAQQTVNYTVLPDNRFTVSHVKGHPDGSVSFDIKIPGAGRVSVLGTAPTANLASVRLTPGPGRFAFAQLSKTVRRAGKLQITLKPTARGARLVTNHHSAVVIGLQVAFTPKGGKARTVRLFGIPIG